MDYFIEWAVSVIFIAVACGFLESAAPSGNLKKFISYIFSIVFLSVLISPIELLA